MQPKWHILWGFVFSYLIAYFFSLSFIHFTILFLSTWFFIDLDHAVIYVLKTKNFNPWKFIQWSKEKKEERMALTASEKLKTEFPHFFMHSAEFLILLTLLSFLNENFLFILLGFIFHLIFDWIAMPYEEENILFKISQIYTYIKNKKAKKLKLS